jgi:TonB family protein
MGMRVTVRWALLVSLTFAPQVALADPPPAVSMPHVISNPDWLERPTRMLYPAAAQRAHVSGSARIECAVTSEGRLENCEVLVEDPPGYGFGQTALDMASQFLMRPRTRDGLPVGGAKVVIPMRFQFPDDPPPAAALGQPAPAPAPVSAGMPHWIQHPDGDDIARVYPSAGLRAGVGGHAVIVCRVTADGSMSACKLLSEEPAGMGFGEAALKLAPNFKLSATTSDGRSVEGVTIKIPMTFAPPAAP